MSILQLTQTVQIVPSAYTRPAKQAMQPSLPGMELAPDEQPMVTNRQIAEVLASIAEMLERQNSNPYRVQAYRHAARGVLELSEPAALIVAQGEALPVPGLGERLQKRIAELVMTGTMTFYHDLSMPFLPSGARALMGVEHVGPHVAIRLHEELGIDSPKKLLRAAQNQRIRTLPGFGARSEARLAEAAASYLERAQPEQLAGVA
jgi:DNA polymerase (family 10)